MQSCDADSSDPSVPSRSSITSGRTISPCTARGLRRPSVVPRAAHGEPALVGPPSQAPSGSTNATSAYRWAIMNAAISESWTASMMATSSARLYCRRTSICELGTDAVFQQSIADSAGRRPDMPR